MTIWIDATSTVGSDGIHGMSRVERELIRACLDRPNVRFFRLSPDRLVPVGSDELRHTIETDIASTAGQEHSKGSARESRPLGTLLDLAISFFVGGFQGFQRHVKGHTLKALVLLRSLARNYPAWVLKSVVAFRALGRKANRRIRPILGSASPVRFVLGDDVAPGDWLVFASPFWKYVDEARIGKAVRQQGARLSVMIYDLVPIKMPHVSFRPHLRNYAKFFSLLPWVADDILANSRSVQKDVEGLVELARGKPGGVRRVTLGTDHILRFPSQAVPAMLERAYFLFVGTIEPRKNIKVLLEAYRSFLRKSSKQADLVIVGSYGWASDEIRNFLELDPELTGRNRARVRVFNDIDDSELRWLYENCIALLYPSLHEGFGLPVAEALSLGRPVRISAGGALPEFEPYGAKIVGWSPQEWSEEMEALCSADQVLTMKSGQMPSPIGTWVDFSDQWLRELEG